MFDRYWAVNDMTFKRFQKARENSEHITATTLQQWALAYASELNCSRFVASTRWINKFKRKYGIRQRKITRYVGRGEIATAEQILEAATNFRTRVRELG